MAGGRVRARGGGEAADFYYLVTFVLCLLYLLLPLHHTHIYNIITLIERGLGVLMFIYCA